MTLTRLVLRNFQCHRKLEVDLDEYCTTIVGPSDRGKSAVLRALRWLCTNYPDGRAFCRRVGEKVAGTTRVSVGVYPQTVCRIRGDGRNTYSLDGSRYAALGRGKVPDDVAKLLNVGEVNFQGQLDGPFWFCLTPGQVSRELNQIINLDLIDTVLGRAASDLRKARAERDVAERRLAAARERRDGLAWVVEADADLRQVEQLYSTLEANLEKRRVLRSSLENVSRVTQAFSDVVQAKCATGNAVRIGEAALQTRCRADDLRNVIDRCTDLRGQLCKIRNKRTVVESRLAKVKKCPVCRGPLPSSRSSSATRTSP